MPRYNEVRVPRGVSRKWEIVIEEPVENVPRSRTAVEVKHDHRMLRDIPDSLLRDVPLLATGAALERGERYIDLHDPARGEFSSDGHEYVRPGQRVIARRSAPPEVWRALLASAEAFLRGSRGAA